LPSTAPLPSVARSVPLTFRTHIAFVLKLDHRPARIERPGTGQIEMA
jgi:hypothetical protein